MKRNVCLIIILLFLLSICFYLNNKTKSKVVIIDNIKYLITVDGNNVASFPTTGLYQVDTSCINANSKWDYDTSTLKISDVIGEVSCSLNFNSITSPINLGSYIRSLSESGTLQGEAAGDGYVIHEIYEDTTNSINYDTGYRYEGRDPYNYIWFNNELWRIIGVFDETDHDVTGTNLTKIIRANSLGGYVWNKNNTNNWATSSLRTLLNTYYYNKINDNNGDSINNYCYGYSTTVPMVCDFATYGINSNYRNMIELVTWQLGGSNTYSMTSGASYAYERGDTKYGSNSLNVEDYIGLMYPSDYGYSVLASNCARTTNLNSYSNSNCAGKSWLKHETYEWTLMHNSGYSYIVFILYYTGSLNGGNSNFGFASRPVLYLKSNTYIIDGDGSINDPYIIGM